MMPQLSLSELLTVTGTTLQGLKTLRRRDQVAGAFGLRHAYENFKFLPLDAIGFLLSGSLAKAYGQTEAAQLVRVHGDVWAEVVAEAEADPLSDQSFCIVDFERESDGKSAHMACGARDATPERIAATLQRTPAAEGFVAVRVNCVNVSYLMRVLRTTAAKHDIDLLNPFLPPRGHPAFAEIFAPYVKSRDAAIVSVRDRKSRETLAAKLGQKARAAIEVVQ
jgi:hypothetical protein